MRKERVQWLVKCRNSRRTLALAERLPAFKTSAEFFRAYLGSRAPADLKISSDYFIVLRMDPLFSFVRGATVHFIFNWLERAGR